MLLFNHTYLLMKSSHYISVGFDLFIGKSFLVIELLKRTRYDFNLQKLEEQNSTI